MPPFPCMLVIISILEENFNFKVSQHPIVMTRKNQFSLGFWFMVFAKKKIIRIKNKPENPFLTMISQINYRVIQLMGLGLTGLSGEIQVCPDRPRTVLIGLTSRFIFLDKIRSVRYEKL